MKSDETELVAKSPAMRGVVTMAERVAPTEASVMISGESGTGKGRIARFIHEQSGRAGGPFVAVNCGALPDTLLESELFGHRKGAFTGADADREGLFASAGGGTLFLDEVGETSPSMQVSLLRALQDRVVRPLGSTVEVEVDVRILAATNRDLDRLVEEGAFREDLYYRLRVVTMEIPPLRERPEDILVLAQQLISRTCNAHSCGPCSLSSEVLDRLQAYPWPGNVRELDNAIERAVILAEGQPRIEVSDLPPEIRSSFPPRNHQTDGILTLEEMERRHILATLDRLDGHRKRTAQALGIGENTLWRKLKRYGKVRSRK